MAACRGCTFLLTELPWNLLAVPGIFAAAAPSFDGTCSQAHRSAISLILNLTTLIMSGGQVPKTTLRLAVNPTPAGWNHFCGEKYPQPSHKPPFK